MMLRALLYLGSLQRRGAGGHHGALRYWLSRVQCPTPGHTALPAAPAAQPWGPAAAQRQFHAARLWMQAGASQQPAGQPHPGMDTAAAAYLEQHGISTTQLQQEQPAAASALTLPLARLLVRAVAVRQGLKSNNILAPAELAARLVFLASEAGVSVDTLGRVYLCQLVNIYFKLDSARGVLAWLRANLPDATLQRVTANHPGIWRSLQPTFKVAKPDLQQMFSLSHAEWVAAVHSDPQLLTSFLRSTAEEMVRWLRSDAGMSEEDISRLFKREPSVFLMKASRMSGLVNYLLDRLHIDRGKAATVVLNCSSVFALSEDSLEGRVADLEQYGFVFSFNVCDAGFTARQIGKMLLAAHLLLTSTFQSTISPALSELEQLLTGHLPGIAAQERQAAVVEVAARAAGLVLSKPAKLRGNFDFVLSQGLPLDTARDVLRRYPQVFAHDMRSRGFGDKLHYYESELGIPATKMLVEHGGYLTSGLAKVDQRVFCMERRGELQRLRPDKGRTLAWVTDSPASFRARFGISLKEWEECMAEWPATERAQQYGLVQQASKRGYGVDCSKGSAAAKASASRRREGK